MKLKNILQAIFCVKHWNKQNKKEKTENFARLPAYTYGIIKTIKVKRLVYK